MSSKKYTDFPSGTYDTSKIFLQADAVTGALEKINLPTITSGSPFYCNAPNTNNSGTNPQTTATVTIPANALPNVGDSIVVKAFANLITSSGSKILQVDYNGVTNSNTSNTAVVPKDLTAYIVRISSTQAFIYSVWQTFFSFSDAISGSIIDYNVTDPFTINLKVTTGAANSITTRFLSAQVLNV